MLIAVAEELLNDPTPEAMESLAALLTCIGPTFDKLRHAWRGMKWHGRAQACIAVA